MLYTIAVILIVLCCWVSSPRTRWGASSTSFWSSRW
jgi:hypothetical protein